LRTTPYVSNHRPRTRRRHLAGLLVVVAGGLSLVAAGRSSGPTVVRLEAAGRTLAEVDVLDPEGDRRPARAVAADARRLVPATLQASRGSARVTLVVDREATARAAARAATSPRPITVVSRAVSSSIPAPVVAQALRNNCETAALQVLLRTLGIDSDQLRLQAQVERDGPADPVGVAPDEVWGDPEQGYVGRADGTGPAGGFGVYQGPIARLAQRRGATLDDLTGASPRRIYQRVLDGRAVMAWVGLADGPYGTWRSPARRPVRVNFNEHTVVLTGVRRDGSLDVVNVLDGTREQWSRALFEERFARLGQRALAAPPRAY